MPRLSHRLPKYRKHKASGRAVVSLGGRDHYLGPWKSAASKREYDRLTGERLAFGGIAVQSADDDLTVCELAAAFKKHAKAYYVDAAGKPNNEYGCFVTLVRRLSKAYGNTAFPENSNPIEVMT